MSVRGRLLAGRRPLTFGILACLIVGPFLPLLLHSPASDAAPSPLIVPSGNIGDKIGYDGRIETFVAGHPAISQHYAVAFEVKGASTTIDRWGRPHRVVDVLQTDDEGVAFASEGLTPPGQRLWHVDAASRDVVRLDSQSETPEEAFADAQSDLRTAGWYNVHSVFEPAYGEAPRWSGFPLFRYNGMTLDPGAAPVVDGPCTRNTRFGLTTVDLQRTERGDPGTWETAAALQVHRTTLHSFAFKASVVHAQTAETLTFAQGLPYPVLIERQFVQHRPSGDIVVKETERLLHVVAGGDPIDWPPVASSGPCGNDGPAAPVERTQGPFPTGEVRDVPFSQPDARRTAESSASYTRWRAAHADVLLVGYSYFGPPGTPLDAYPWIPSWGFFYQASNGEGLALEVAGAGNGLQGVATEVPLVEANWPLVTRADLPAQAVVLARAREVWSAVTSDDLRGRGINTIRWGLSDIDDSAYDCNDSGYCQGVRGAAGLAALHTIVAGYSSGSNLGRFQNSSSGDEVYVDVDTGAVRDYRYDLFYGRLNGVPGPQQERLEPFAATAPPARGGPDFRAMSASTLGLLGAFLLAYLVPTIRGLFTGWGAFAKLRRDRLLDHQMREQLRELVARQPGIDPPAMAKTLGMKWSTLNYHLRVLEKNKVLSSLLDGRHRRFFLVGAVDWGKRDHVAALSNPTTKAVYEAIVAEPGIIQSSLASRVAISAQALQRHVERLAALGLIRRERRGRVGLCFPGQARPLTTATPVMPLSAEAA